MKYYELTKEEKELMESMDAGEWKPVKDASKARAQYQSIASATLSRSRNINIRLSERVLQKLKARAAEKGIPYQTLVASILHQYSTGS